MNGKVIYKYPFSPVGLDSIDKLVIKLPPLAKVVHVATQGNSVAPVLWIEQDSELPATETRTFRFFGTGHPIPADGVEHVGSTIAGQFVWHVYEVIQ